jgi:seryl-tRNA synthetase
LEKSRSDAEKILQQLHLPYSMLLIGIGDIRFAHSKQHDLEA